MTEIRQTEREAQVVTADGAVYKGDLVVGADGIHSVVRAEMWRQAKDLVGRRDRQGVLCNISSLLQTLIMSLQHSLSNMLVFLEFRALSPVWRVGSMLTLTRMGSV